MITNQRITASIFSIRDIEGKRLGIIVKKVSLNNKTYTFLSFNGYNYLVGTEGII